MSSVIVIGVSDLIYELEKYDARDMVNKTALGNIFKVFKNYSLMDVDGNVGDIDCKLILYPSLQFALDTNEFERFVILSFQCTMNGTYIEHTLSLSTVIWAISQVEGKTIEKLSALLSSKAYSDTIEMLEKKFFGSDNSNEQNTTEEVSVKLSSEGMPVFADDGIVASKVTRIYSEIVKTYGKFLPNNTIEEKNGLKYQLFKDLKAKNKYDDDNYMGLRHDFFSDDLKMVKDSIEEDKDNYSTGMLSGLIDYICAPHDILKERKRHDFVRPKDKEVFYEEIAEILNMENAPIGKWPSRYMPALMQQIAVNIAISNQKGGIFGERGTIFSVNGPPGTGKTTLLKEIIANSIVEKAKILSQYDIPDAAFTGVEFVRGKLNGAYAQYYPKWFKFKDERIADYASFSRMLYQMKFLQAHMFPDGFF